MFSSLNLQLKPEINHDSKQVLTIDSYDLSKKFFREVFNSQLSPGHGVICVFRGDDKKNYVLASPRINPESNSVQLQVAIGGRINATKVVLDSLQDTIDFKTNSSQSSLLLRYNFNLSNHFFAFTHAEWNMCYLTFIAATNGEYALNQLRNITNTMNQTGEKKFQYGIYDLDQILQLVAQTHHQDEKLKSYIGITNYLPEKPITLKGVIFDDIAIHGLATHLTAQEVQMLVSKHNIPGNN